MNKIIEEAEKTYWPDIKSKRPKPNSKSTNFHSDVICFKAAQVAEDIHAKAIIGMTVSGYTGFKLSSYRPNSKIYIFSEQKHILSTMNLCWGTRCYFYDKFSTTDETIEDVNAIACKKGFLDVGDMLISLAAMPIKDKGMVNTLRVTEIETCSF